MSDKKFGFSYFIFLIVALLVIIGMITVSYYRSAAAMDSLTRTLDRENDIRKILLSLQDAETGQRGYVITREEPYLEPFKKAKNEYVLNIEAVRNQVRDNPTQAERLDVVDSLAQIHFEELEETIFLIKDDQLRKSIRIIKGDTGKMVMDSIRVVIDQMLDEERKQLAERKVKSRAWKYGIIGLIIISALIILFSLFNLYQRIKPLFEELMETKDKLKKVNNNLSESLFKWKKVSQEKEQESIEKGKVIEQNEHLIQQLRLEEKHINRLTQSATDDLTTLLKELTEQIEQFKKSKTELSEMEEVSLTRIKAIVKDMNHITTQLDENQNE